VSNSAAPAELLRHRLAEIRDRVAGAAEAAGRAPADVRILLATKTQDAATIATAVAAGFPLIGENRVQEVVHKAAELAELLPDVELERHFIGHLQSNKINQLVPLVNCVQTVDSVELAGKLALRAATDRRRLPVLAQVNVSGEVTKSGVPPERVFELVEAIAAHEALDLRGLMTIGLNSPDPGAVRAGYQLLASLRDEIRALAGGGPGGGTGGRTELAELSMGMSNDYELAIAAGATIVRIGSAVFGPRQLG
jgi:pyridoxal phosphate enzyme (YggS family)